LSDGVFDLEKYDYTQLFYKKLCEEQTTKGQTVDCEFQWSTDLYDEDIPQIYDNFGIFVRKNGIIKGGLFGTINDKAVVPHSCIEAFWIDDKRRGMRLGTKVMEFALNHLKERDACIAELYTTDFQAPGFYEKMSFNKIFTYPNIFKVLDGKLNNSYLYRKEL
jgi:ribosomal protein S18 acetylase RimI-like enzyme